MICPPPKFQLDPPLLNSATPWATTLEEIRDLYDCPYTGAVTIRTSLLGGFNHHSDIHQYTFFSPSIGHSTSPISHEGASAAAGPSETSSLNTLGYSPTPLPTYLSIILSAATLHNFPFRLKPSKPIILSVTGSPSEIAQCYASISSAQSMIRRMHPDLTLMMEINLSCPNIPDKPPPAYDAQNLNEYLAHLADARGVAPTRVMVGLKTPPYTHQGQFDALVGAIEGSLALPGGCPLSFITATNTLGSCLVLGPDGMTPALGSATGEGIGGMAGEALHSLALGNVFMLRKMLDARAGLDYIAVIGVGGVSDKAGFERMKGVGAAAVGVGTALGREGLAIFEKISGNDKASEISGAGKVRSFLRVERR